MPLENAQRRIELRVVNDGGVVVVRHFSAENGKLNGRSNRIDKRLDEREKELKVERKDFKQK